MKVYKVVRRSQLHLISVLAEGELQVTYHPGLRTLPPHPNLPLTAFRTRKLARLFMKLDLGDVPAEIWIAEALEYEKLYPWISYMGSIDHLLNMLLKKEDLIFNWPYGTVFCSQITLKKRIER